MGGDPGPPEASDVQSVDDSVQGTTTTCPPGGRVTFTQGWLMEGGATQNFQAWVSNFHWTEGVSVALCPSLLGASRAISALVSVTMTTVAGATATGRAEVTNTTTCGA